MEPRKIESLPISPPLQQLLWRGLMVFCWSIAFLSSAHAAEPAAAPIYSHAAVAADHPLASQAGVEVLRAGGNVVDAAVATGFALSVLRPASSGIGGGGFMVIWDAEQQRAVTLDYRERAPQSATKDMYAAPPKGVAPLSEKGGLAVAVPGHVAGLCFAQQKYGKLKLKDVLQPAMRLAREGVELDTHELNVRRSALRTFKAKPELKTKYAALWEHYLSSGDLEKIAPKFRSPQLKALEQIAEQGRDGFYGGPVAAAMVDAVRKAGGKLSLDDLAAMDVVEREPLTTQFRGLKLVTMPPPSSGGIALIETLQVLKQLEQRAQAPQRLADMKHNSPPYLHLLTETMKHAFADRATFLGDADFVEVPIKKLTSDEYALQLANRVQVDRTLKLEEYGSDPKAVIGKDDHGTTHFSVMDAAGNAVACTETVNTSFGSWVVEPQFGIVLNNEMDDFAARPGEPNAFGLIQGEANAVAPRKKPLSSMTPTIAIQDGRAVQALGASGGPRIISTTIQVLLNLTQFDMEPEQAVTAPRVHHQWRPNQLLIEGDLPKDARQPLAKLGHDLKVENALAICQVVSRTPQGLKAKSDPRKHGQAAGY